MASNTKAFEPEGSRNRFKDLLYKKSKTKRSPKILKASASYILEAGEELIKLKKNTAYGGFTETVQNMGILPNFAQRCMRVFKKFGAYRETAEKLGAGKLYILMSMKEPDIKTLMDGGSVSGVTLNDIARMSIKEARNILIKRRKLPSHITRCRRMALFIKHIKKAFSVLRGGVK